MCFPYSRKGILTCDPKRNRIKIQSTAFGAREHRSRREKRVWWKVCHSRLRINICFFGFVCPVTDDVRTIWCEFSRGHLRILKCLFHRFVALDSLLGDCFVLRTRCLAFFIHVYPVIQRERSLFAVSNSQEVTPVRSVLVSIF